MSSPLLPYKPQRKKLTLKLAFGPLTVSAAYKVHWSRLILHSFPLFQVNSDNFLFVKDPSYLNYENLYPSTVLTVTIKATDVPEKHTGPPISVIGDVDIRVIDVNEAPYDIRLIPDNVTIPENVSIGYCIAQITSKNPERAQTVEYSLLNYKDTFGIEVNCEENSSAVSDGKKHLPYLTVKSHLSYDDYKRRGYKILIEAEDNGLPPQSFNDTVEVHVIKIDPCPSSTCHVDATCIRVDWKNYSCKCNEGYTGDGFNCSDINDCLSFPCSFGGTCHDYVNYYNCTCPSGYHNGTDCTLIDYCLSNPCQNNGMCAPFRNGYNCTCTSGFTGVHCETNIDDCASELCFKGACVDGIDSFTCNCRPGFSGTLCERAPEECEENPCKEQEICVPPNLQKNYSVQCISVDFVVTLDFPERVNTSSSPWQYKFETMINGLKFSVTEVTNNEFRSQTVNVADVYIISPSLQQPAKAKRSAPEQGSSVDFVVIIKSNNKLQGVPKKAVLCDINNTCLNYGYAKEKSPGSFLSDVCSSTVQKIEYLGISDCVPREAKDAHLKNEKHYTTMRLYYVIGGTALVLLIVILVGLLLCRRNRLTKKELKLIKQERYREAHTDDEAYTDIMYRHHLAKQETEAQGAFNPIYGTGEEEVNRQVNVTDNPIYQEPASDRAVKRTESTTGFENPMYQSVQRGKHDGTEEEEEIKAIGFSNPMFVSRRQVK